jgi:hypothetical protein
MTIIVSKNGSDAKIIRPVGFGSESSLQEYIHQNPESIPIHELNEDKKLLIVKREFPTSSGPIDALAIDKEGEIYIIETKLYKNPDKRKVIAQALDYGASLWVSQLDLSHLIEISDNEILSKFGLTFEDKLKEFYGLDDQMVDHLKSNLHNNLKDGRLKFVILMDQIDQKMKDLIVYINQNSKFDIYGVRFKFYKVDHLEVLIPRLFGAEVKKDLSSRPDRIVWNRNLFLQKLTENTGFVESNIVTQILDWIEAKGLKLTWGTGPKIGTFHSYYRIGDLDIKLFVVNTGGNFEILFKNFPLDFERKIEMIHDLNSVGEISIDEEKAKTWSSFPLVVFADTTNFDTFFDVFEEWITKFS